MQVAKLASKMELKGMKLFRTILFENLSRTEELDFLLEVQDFCLHLGLHVWWLLLSLLRDQTKEESNTSCSHSYHMKKACHSRP
jgi:hypothetical protein